jgi:UDP-N-acetylmuramoyl-tripeptide--D-alanyl-D-alanine ligase
MDYSVQWKEEEVKKELVFTKRAMRLYVSLIFVDLIEIGIILAVFFMTVNNRQYYFPIILFAETLIYYFQPLNIILGNMIVEPIEIKINRHFYLKAQAKIKSLKNLTSIGITGSFGKTSTKFIVATIFEKKFKTLNTPESYNTAMGISKVINNDLNEDYEIFVAEMGARNIGDIKELTELVHPKIGIITSIGETHLETFLNLENIMKTKYELIEGLPADGVAIFNYDNEYVRKLADKTFKEKLLYGLGDSEKLDLYATDIEISELGSSFNINDKEGNKIRCTTKLLGKHNIYNILAGVRLEESWDCLLKK